MFSTYKELALATLDIIIKRGIPAWRLRKFIRLGDPSLGFSETQIGADIVVLGGLLGL